MLKVSTTPPTESEVEIAAQQAEGRKSSAEGEIVVLGETKKKLETNLEKINEDIKAGKETIDLNNEEINRTNELKLEAQNSLRQVKQELEDFVTESNSKKSVINEDILKKESERDSLSGVIADLSKQHESNKLSQATEIKELEEKKTSLITEVAGLETKKTEVTKDIETGNLNFKTLGEEIEKKTSEKSEIVSTVGALLIEAENQKGIIENKKVIVGQLDVKIEDKNKEISDIDEKINVKNQEYTQIEKRVFILSTKETVLNQRESFIKSQYDRAGIAWEPLPDNK